jgi:hypothetical protein
MAPPNWKRTHRHVKFRSRRLFTWVFRASAPLMIAWEQFESMLGLPINIKESRNYPLDIPQLGAM